MNNPTFNVTFRKASDRKPPADPNEHAKGGSSPAAAAATSTTTGVQSGDALTCAYSYDTDILAVGTSRGSVMLLHSDNAYRPASFELTSAMCRGEAMKSAAACVRFRPGSDRSTKDLLLCASTDGSVSCWHLGSVQMVFADTATASSSDDNSSSNNSFVGANEMYACDFDPQGHNFCATGKDGSVRLYDANRMSRTAVLRWGVLSDSYPAHSSRVQAARWAEPNVILTGGWDHTVQVWDTRTQRAVSRIAGPYLCGDGIDCFGGMVVTASTRPEHNLQLFDLRTLKPLCELRYPMAPSTANSVEPYPTSLFAARFSPDGRFLATGGTIDYRLYDMKRTFHDANFNLADAVKTTTDKGKCNNSGDADEDQEQKGVSDASKTKVIDGVECGTILQDGGVNAAVFAVAWKGNAMTAAVGFGNSISVLSKIG